MQEKYQNKYFLENKEHFYGSQTFLYKATTIKWKSCENSWAIKSLSNIPPFYPYVDITLMG